MTTYDYRPIAPDVAEQLRDRDDSGSARMPAVDAQGGAPLRCCLRRSRVGEAIVLVSYAPLRRWAIETSADPCAYDEVGPVFIHARRCEGPAREGFPGEVASSLRVYRAYDKGGRILGGVLVDPAPGYAQEVAEAALHDLFSDPSAELVHVRAVEFGCFQFEVRRPG
jgi:hypothetical protein